MEADMEDGCLWGTGEEERSTEDCVGTGIRDIEEHFPY